MAWLKWLDKALNAFPLMGRHWEYISGRAWEARAKGKTWGRIAVRLIDGVFGQGHCERSAD